MMDPLKIMNAVCRWSALEGVPPQDERWHKKIAALCEYAAACRDLTFIRHRQVKMARKGIIRDSTFEKELYDAVEKVTQIEDALGIGLP